MSLYKILHHPGPRADAVLQVVGLMPFYAITRVKHTTDPQGWQGRWGTGGAGR